MTEKERRLDELIQDLYDWEVNIHSHKYLSSSRDYWSLENSLNKLKKALQKLDGADLDIVCLYLKMLPTTTKFNDDIFA